MFLYCGIMIYLIISSLPGLTPSRNVSTFKGNIFFLQSFLLHLYPEITKSFMDFEKIFVSLDESHRKTILTVIVCSLIFHAIFYASFDFYRSIEWYSQLLFSLGISVCYVSTFIFIFIWLIPLTYLSLNPTVIPSCDFFFFYCIPYR